MRTALVSSVVTAAATAACLVAAAATWPTASAAPAAGSAHVRTLAFDVRFSQFFVVDFSATGVRTLTDLTQSDPSIGDASVFHDTLLRAGRTVGDDGGSCTVTHVDFAASPPLDIACQVTFDIPGGSIATQGNATDDPVKHLVITGGSGAFTGATGEVLLTEFADNTGSVVIRLAS